MKRILAGIMGDMMPYNEPAVQPSWFNLIKNNTVSNCAHALEITVADWGHDLSASAPTLAGNVWRDNATVDSVTNAFNYRDHFADDMPVELTVFHGSSTEGDDPVNAIENLNNQIWVDNEFSGSGTGITITDGHIPALHNNQWNGYTSNYADAVSGAILELPTRRVDALAASMDVPVWNSGTEPLNWTASEISSWITLSVTNGTVVGENEEGTLSFSIDLNSASGEADIAVIANSQTQTVTVVAQ